MYPVLKEGVSIGTFQYDGSDATHYFVKNADGEDFEISYRLWKALLQADGTKPLDLPDNGYQMLYKLKQHGLVRTSRFVRDNGIFNRFILFPIGRQSTNGKLICRVINATLPILSALFFAIGIFLIKTRDTDTGGQFNWWLYYSFLVCSLALHEIGHLIAGLAYGYRISDTGILLLGIIPIGAYVAHADKKDASRSEKMQFALAGVEMNLLMAGICLLVATKCYPLSLVMVSVANVNVILAGINLLPASGLDGESALSAVCGVNSIGKLAQKCLFNKGPRNKLLHSGFRGYACFCVFAITIISRIILWILIGLDVVLVLYNILL